MIAIGSDHAAYELKNFIASYLEQKGYTVQSYGSANGEPVDYPDVAKEVCAKVTSGEAEFAFLFCGTGIGISIAANKIKGIRAALCSDAFSARMARMHNDANVLCIGGRTTGQFIAADIVDNFLAASFEGGRHQARVEKINQLD